MIILAARSGKTAPGEGRERGRIASEGPAKSGKKFTCAFFRRTFLTNVCRRCILLVLTTTAPGGMMIQLERAKQRGSAVGGFRCAWSAPATEPAAGPSACSPVRGEQPDGLTPPARLARARAGHSLGEIEV